MTVYSLEVNLPQFRSSLLFHVWLNGCFLACIQIFQEASKVVWYSHLLKTFLQFVVIHTVKCFIIDNEADDFLELSCFFYNPMDVGNLISGSSVFSKSSLNIWKFSVHVLLKPSLENFEHYFASVWDACSCTVVWTFFGIAFLWDWNENWHFPVLWPLPSFPNLLAYWVQQYGCLDHSKLWNILQEMRIPDHLTCLLRNLNTGQEEQLEPDMEQLTGSKLGKGSTTRQYIVMLLI